MQPAMGHEVMSEPLGMPPGRHSSGTAWMPDSTPMYGLTDQSDGWNLAYHGAAHLAYLHMNGPRGDADLDILNWAMVMARHQGRPHRQWLLKGMVSLDPVTIGGEGYPLLFQTGETWRGEPLHDYQHPHNYVSELATKYTREFHGNAAGFLYFGVVGEPALGPPAYMHRTFALDDPAAPIGHHWQDSTHISYGVLTAGYQRRRWQAELSTFNGREPGENRWVIRAPRFDSWSGRLSANPSPNWALQLSHGFLHSPEVLHPEEDTRRTTASAVYNRPLGASRNLQAALVWGRNRTAGRDYDSILLEVQRKRDGGWTPYARYEYVEKSAEELVVPGFPGDRAFHLNQLTVGVSRDLRTRGDLQWGVGAQALFSFVPDELKSTYGDDPVGWILYLRVHPKRMEHAGRGAMGSMTGTPPHSAH